MTESGDLAVFGDEFGTGGDDFLGYFLTTESILTYEVAVITLSLTS